MHRVVRLLVVFGVGAAVTASTMILFAQMPALSLGPGPAQEEVRLQSAVLGNDGFEGEYVQWGGSAERKLAPSWSLWWQTAVPPKADDQGTPRGGAKTQHVYSKDQWSAFDACIYQQISGITVGHYIRFSAWAKVEADPMLDSYEKWQTRIGIDPDGGTDPLDINYYTHLAYWDTYTASPGTWQKLFVSIKATSPAATVYACAHPALSRRLDVYWDDAEFEVQPERLVYLPGLTREHCFVPPGTLLNPDLELDACNLHGYQAPISGYTNVLIAPFWMPFWNDDHDSATHDNAQPECNYVAREDYAYRVHSGEVAQQCGLSGGGAFEGGIYQVITGTNVSDTLRFTIWGLGWRQAWSQHDPDGYNEFVSDEQDPGGLRFRVGIDPRGGELYTSPDIVWSEFDDPYDAWQQFEITATALYTRVSVWAYAHPANSPIIRWNQTFWDGASLEVIETQ
jgi:hypothetical protein